MRNPRKKRIWIVAEAKARLETLVERARACGPQLIVRNGRVAAVLVSGRDWERKVNRAGSLVEFFAASPLRGSGLVVERARDTAREIDL
jgi:prevent-host-death family protein